MQVRDGDRVEQIRLTRVLGVVDVRVLGPIEVADSAGSTVPVNGVRPKALLAYLALRAPQGASSDRIIDEVWFDDPPASMETTLQVTVSRLRKAIGAGLVVTTPDGYRLDVPESNTDLARFHLHAKRGRQLDTLGRHGAAAEAFRQALAEWRGAPLADIRQIEFAERASVQLEEERLAVVEDLLTSTISAGDHRLVLGELSGLCEAFPFRERLWELLMLALYRSGRQADALGAFQRAKRALGESLGIEPSPALVDLEERILLHDSALDLARGDAGYISDSTVFEFPPGAVIVEQGEPADTVYWIEEGSVEVQVTMSDGAPEVVAELGPGRYFGELAALLGTRRTATVTALTAAKLTIHDTESFRTRLGAERTRAPTEDAVRMLEDLMESGQYLAAFDQAAELIQVGEPSVQIRYLAVLALARSGATATARRQYDSVGLSSIDPASISRSLAADIAVLAARLDKDAALASTGELRNRWSERAARGYQSAFDTSSDPYHGVNAATMWLVAGDEAKARTVAGAALRQIDAGAGSDYWSLVQTAEASLILGDVGRASSAIEQAGKLDEHGHSSRATTLKQLRLLIEMTDSDAEVLRPLSNPAVVHYCGHRILPAGQTGRFPADEEQTVAKEIRRSLDRLGAEYGFGSLAAGADILVAEALLERGADLHIVLPFPADQFVGTSVEPAGDSWVERFEACLDAASSVHVVTNSGASADPVLYDYCARVAMGDAIIHSRHLQSEAHQIAIWDRQPSPVATGTAVDVQHWADSGRSTTVIPVSGGAAPARHPGGGTNRQIRALMFADFAGFSRLTDEQVARFQESVMGKLSTVLAEPSEKVLSARTWGDGIYLVLADVAAAATCALEMQAAVDSLDMTELGLPELQGLRVAAHATPVFEGWDEISKMPLFYGSGVTETARIEPRTPEGEIYTTHAFAALAVLSGSDSFDCQYVGTVPTAKGFGEFPLYALRAMDQ